MARLAERPIVVMAVCLAALEKLSRSVAQVGVVWSTVVLLGGYVDALEKRDFWIVTSLLLVEGVRVFLLHHNILPGHGPPILVTIAVTIYILLNTRGTIRFFLSFSCIYLFLVRNHIRQSKGFGARIIAALRPLYVISIQLFTLPATVWKSFTNTRFREDMLVVLRNFIELGLKYTVITVRSTSQVIAFGVAVYQLKLNGRRPRYPNQKHLATALKIFFYVMVMGQSVSISVDHILLPVASLIRDRMAEKKFGAKRPIAAFFNHVYRVTLSSGTTLNEGLKVRLLDFLLDKLPSSSGVHVHSSNKFNGLEILQVFNAECKTNGESMEVKLSCSDRLVHWCLLVTHGYRSLKSPCFMSVELEGLYLLVNLSSSSSVEEEQAVFNVVTKMLHYEYSLDYLDYLADLEGDGELIMKLGVLKVKLLLLLATYPTQNKLASSCREKAGVAVSTLLGFITGASPSCREVTLEVLATDSYYRTESFADQLDNESLNSIRRNVELWNDSKRDDLLAKLGVRLQAKSSEQFVSIDIQM